MEIHKQCLSEKDPEQEAFPSPIKINIQQSC
jgi:hypothetical protein